MANSSEDAGFSTADVLSFFPDLSRDVLYFLERQEVIDPEHVRPRKGRRNKARRYTDEHVRKIFLAAQAHRLGWNADRIIEAVRSPDVLKNERALGVGTAIQIVQDVFRGAATADIWGAVIRFACHQLDCEGCSVHVVSPGAPQDGRVFRGGRLGGLDTATHSGRRLTPPPAWRAAIRTSPVVNLSGESLRTDPFVAAAEPRHLASGKYFSVMAAPIWRRAATGQIRGWLVAENRLGAKELPNPACYFDVAMESAAGMVAALIALILDSITYVEMRQALRTAVSAQPSLGSHLENILQLAVNLTGADRGDVVWYDHVVGRNTVRSNIGASRVMIGEAIDYKSITRRVLEQRRAALIPDVRLEPDYYACDKRTKSELCVPICRPGETRAIGVINVEAFSLNGFDRYDQTLLEELAVTAALYGHVLEMNDMIPTLLTKAHDIPLAAGTEHPDMKALLDQVYDDQRLDRGIVYLADYKRAELRCVAVRGYEGSKKKEKLYEFTYAFSDTALATKVFHERRSYFSERAEVDPHVSKRGLETFDIKGAIVGVPLLFGSVVVGVMVVWSSDGVTTTKRHEASLVPYANLAVTNLALARSQQLRTDELHEHRAELESIREVLRCGATEPAQAVLRRILKALVRVAFDRARVFRKDPEGFVCVDSLDRADSDPSYRGQTIAFTNPYAQMTLKFNPEHGAVVRDPAVTGLQDPDADRFGKPADLPWAAAPLFINKNLYGYIACDKKRSLDDIGESDLESLNVYAALAAQMLVLHAHGPDGEEGTGSP